MQYQVGDCFVAKKKSWDNDIQHVRIESIFPTIGIYLCKCRKFSGEAFRRGYNEKTLNQLFKPNIIRTMKNRKQ